MGEMSAWEMVLVGVIAILVILWFRPGIRAALQYGKEVEEKDWRGFLLPLAFVVLFVIMLLAIA